MLDRIVVGRIGGQLIDAQAVGVRGDKLRGGGRRMVLGPILNEHERLVGLLQDGGQEGAIGGGGEALRLPMGEQSSRKIVDQAEDLVGFTLAVGRDERLLADGCLGIGE